MQRVKRLILALVVVLSGLLLVPYVALPHESFSWKLFVGAYRDVPAMGVNFTTGAPGSFFTVSGYNFPPNQPVTIAVNERTLGTTTASADGSFSVVINTAGADRGVYFVTGDNPNITQRIALTGDAITRFEVLDGAPLRAREGGSSLPLLNLPPGLAEQRVYLPLVRR
jgi:hypothetical protein